MKTPLKYIHVLYQVTWAFILCTFGIAFAIRGDLTHFTWWSLLLFWTYGLTVVLSEETTRLFWFFVTIESIVIGGVCLMSFSECKLFINSEHDAGSTLYFFGNFAMHYFPLLAAVAFTRGILIEKRNFYSDINDIWTAFGVAMIYFALYNPATVYACPLSKSEMLIGTFSATMLITVLRCIPVMLGYH